MRLYIDNINLFKAIQCSDKDGTYTLINSSNFKHIKSNVHLHIGKKKAHIQVLIWLYVEHIYLYGENFEKQIETTNAIKGLTAGYTVLSNLKYTTHIQTHTHTHSHIYI